MADPVITVAVEAQFSAPTWTDITVDVLAADTLTISRAFSGDGGPTDCCARTGMAAFTLRNDAGNLGTAQGYYSPGHANAVAGWGYKTPIRITRTTDGTPAVRFVGWVSAIDPEPGTTGQQRVRVIATDWMEEAAQTPATGITLASDQRADELITTLAALVDRAPTAESYETGLSTFPFALDDVASDGRILEGLARTAQSEGGQLFVAADGTLTHHNRHHRLTATAGATLDETMQGLTVGYDPERVASVVRVTVHPRLIDTAPTTVLATLTSQTPPLINTGDTLIVDAPFQDTDSNLCAGIDGVTPVPSVDYTANSKADGTGYDMTGLLNVSASFEATRVVWTVYNDPGATGFFTGAAYLTLLQARGRGVYALNPVTVEATDATAIAAYGRRVLELDLPYEADPNVAQGWADWWIYCRKDLRTEARTVTFIAQASSALAAAALLDLNDAVDVQEPLTALGGAVLYAIIGITETYSAAGILTIGWMLAPIVSRSDWFVIEDATYGELDATGVLAYV